ncbi:hypothetical protein PR202_gb13419 [Eleusine coracana subsp. coracana]|uniref:Uncharacterized protein n=1 Tax=Eleusine coracana subsp. coracana TaxID=191504 RepID=A0AAV5EQ67_ELECO|nr:hypothetical protein PR202_gb13419 [Eleusine coracana subsp. coracana]
MGNKSSSSASGAGNSDTASTIVTHAVPGSHVLRIDGYSKAKGIGVGKCLNSGNFRVGGYNWSVRFYPHGREITCADWISVSLCLTSPISSDSKTVVMTRFKFSLLDQEGEPVSQYQLTTRDLVTFSASSRIWGFDKFIKRDGGLEGSDYLIDDSFRIKCEVTVYKSSRQQKPSKKENEFVKVPPSKLHLELAGVVWAGKAADVTFEVGSEVFTAHRNVLAARSPVFKAELFGPMKENTGGGSRRVRIQDMEPDMFREMLNFIYTDSLTSMGKEEGIIMAQHLLVAADRYDLNRLKLVCEDKLCSHIDRRNAAATLVLAEQHGYLRSYWSSGSSSNPSGVTNIAVDVEEQVAEETENAMAAETVEDHTENAMATEIVKIILKMLWKLEK